MSISESYLHIYVQVSSGQPKYIGELKLAAISEAVLPFYLHPVNGLVYDVVCERTVCLLVLRHLYLLNYLYSTWLHLHLIFTTSEIKSNNLFNIYASALCCQLQLTGQWCIIYEIPNQNIDWVIPIKQSNYVIESEFEICKIK